MAKMKRKSQPPRKPAAPIDPDQKLLKLNQAGKVLGMHEASAYRLAKEGRIPSLRIGKAIRIPREALERLIESGALGKVKAAR